jgi:hypothetical protein
METTRVSVIESVKSVISCTGLITVLVTILGIVPRSGLAQSTGVLGGDGSLSIQSFNLQGQGCPNRNAVRVTLNSVSDGSQLLSAQFNSGSFQLNGPNQTRSCTLHFQLAFDGFRNRASGEFAFDSGAAFISNESFGDVTGSLILANVEAAVSSVGNRNATGAVTVRSKSRVNGNTSPIQTVTLGIPATTQAQEALFQPNLPLQEDRTLEVLTAVQVQNGNNRGTVQIREIELEFQPTAFDPTDGLESGFGF